MAAPNRINSFHIALLRIRPEVAQLCERKRRVTQSSQPHPDSELILIGIRKERNEHKTAMIRGSVRGDIGHKIRRKIISYSAIELYGGPSLKAFPHITIPKSGDGCASFHFFKVLTSLS